MHVVGRRRIFFRAVSANKSGVAGNAAMMRLRMRPIRRGFSTRAIRAVQCFSCSSRVGTQRLTSSAVCRAAVWRAPAVVVAPKVMEFHCATRQCDDGRNGRRFQLERFEGFFDQSSLECAQQVFSSAGRLNILDAISRNCPAKAKSNGCGACAAAMAGPPPCRLLRAARSGLAAGVPA